MRDRREVGFATGRLLLSEEEAEEEEEAKERLPAGRITAVAAPARERRGAAVRVIKGVVMVMLISM